MLYIIMYKKSSSRIFNIIVLKRAGLNNQDLLLLYTAYVRAVLEYAAPVWHPGLTGA